MNSSTKVLSFLTILVLASGCLAEVSPAEGHRESLQGAIEFPDIETMFAAPTVTVLMDWYDPEHNLAQGRVAVGSDGEIAVEVHATATELAQYNATGSFEFTFEPILLGSLVALTASREPIDVTLEDIPGVLRDHQEFGFLCGFRKVAGSLGSAGEPRPIALAVSAPGGIVLPDPTIAGSNLCNISVLFGGGCGGFCFLPLPEIFGDPYDHDIVHGHFEPELMGSCEARYWDSSGSFGMCFCKEDGGL